jgi:hypothetical protein
MLATYTNTENHPAVIGTRSAAEKRRRAEAQAQAQLQAPHASAAAPGDVRSVAEGQDEEEEEDSGSETEMDEPKVTVARPKGESAEERKARKAAVKAERAVRADLDASCLADESEGLCSMLTGCRLDERRRSRTPLRLVRRERSSWRVTRRWWRAVELPTLLLELVVSSPFDRHDREWRW